MCPIVNPDFSEGPKLQPGSYSAKIIGCEQKQSRQGSPYLNWKFETQTHDRATDRQWIFLATTFSGKGAQLLKSLVKAAKYPAYEGGPINTDELIGSLVTLTVDRNYNQDGSESHFPRVIEIATASHDDFDAFEEGGRA
jgi:hypothetical protein